MRWQASAHEESWRTTGVDSRTIGTFVTNQGMNCFVLWKGRKIREYRARTNRRKGAIAFTVDGTHAWFYSETEARRAVSHLRIRGRTSTAQSKVAVDGFEAKRPEYSEWHSWAPFSDEEGYFECENLVDARAHYLHRGISPKVMCQGGPITSLYIPLYKQHVFASKPYALSLWMWSQALLKRGYGVPYCGESLSVYTHSVIMALVKNKRRQVTAACRKQSSPNTRTDAPSVATWVTRTTTFSNWTTQHPCATAGTTPRS